MQLHTYTRIFFYFSITLSFFKGATRGRPWSKSDGRGEIKILKYFYKNNFDTKVLAKEEREESTMIVCSCMLWLHPHPPLLYKIGKICLPYREKKTKRERRGNRLEPNKTTVSSLDSLGDARLLENPIYGAGGSCAVSVRGPWVRYPRGLRPCRIYARGRAGADAVRA
jgi:hypothetical protein